MAATQTVHQLFPSRNSLVPRHGVVTLYGYGIVVNVDRGHLVLKDGIGGHRFEARFPRVGHGLRRLVVIGSDGVISLAALLWLADQKAAFVMLERDGTVLATTGPVRPSDARLRRAQALAHQSGIALRIARELIDKKLAGQEQLAIDRLNSPAAAQTIAQARHAVTTAETTEALRLFESQAAYAYWSAWRNVTLTFPRNDLRRVPDHWRCFGMRASPLTGSPRLAVNPLNAILNYLYAILESEARLAAAALGLDPGIGLMHVDSPARDSLASDLMEPVRPQVDAFLLDWIARAPLRREWFFEQRDGNCRLMGSFAVRLSETATTWGRAVAPIAEMVARALSSTVKKQIHSGLPPTRLTGSSRREARGLSGNVPAPTPPEPILLCGGCGVSIERGREFCKACGLVCSTERMPEVARIGRMTAHSAKAQASRTETQRRNALAQNAWKESDQPVWLTRKVYAEQIQPRLAGTLASALASALNISRFYAGKIKAGGRRPHPRHWEKLAAFVGVTSDL